jgi:hypothetical protein
LLLVALERAERHLTRDRGDQPLASSTPALAVFLTGAGALRDSFEARAARRHFKAIAVKTVWIDPSTIQRSWHGGSRSLPASVLVRLDLPMKLADLRGAGVPAASTTTRPCCLK